VETAPADDPWQAFEPRLRAYVRARVDTSSADDVVGDILLRLVQHRGDLERARKPLAWIMRVATNAITDHYRRHSAERRMLARVTDDPSGSSMAAESGDDSQAELTQCLVPLIRGLPEKYSEALLLTEIGGLTQTAAAARPGVFPATMKSRVQRGRARIKQALLHCCEIEVDRRGGVVDYAEHTRLSACEEC